MMPPTSRLLDDAMVISISLVLTETRCFDALLRMPLMTLVLPFLVFKLATALNSFSRCRWPYPQRISKRRPGDRAERALSTNDQIMGKGRD